ncbi:helix-turn-helix transcriptional regulator [Streptomyces sp. NPDC051597]|uniref:helix-turn-helix domain-containing protein n=1 Tax=Streptomyces sp. NPDC051597 TaxID=3155049 RepID=UPI0034365D16
MPSRRNPYPAWILERRVALGQQIAEQRRLAGLSQDGLADRAGVDRRSIQRYENAVRDPRVADLLLIADALGIHVTDLLRDQAPPR